MNLRQKILAVIEACFKEDEVEFSPELLMRPIMEIGADSLTYAVIVARLERDMSLDPFSANPDLPYPQTLEDFIQAYEREIEEK